MANPTVRASSTNGSSTGSPTGLLPAGTINGDVLVASVSDPNGSASNPGGWTLLYGPTIVGTRYLSIWSKVAASEPGSWIWAGSGSGYVVNVAAIQDCASATPAASAAQNNASSVNLVAPSITPGVANTLLIGAFMVEASVTDITPAGTMTEDQDAPRGANYRVELAHESYAPATATGTRTATATAAGANTGWLGAFYGGAPPPPTQSYRSSTTNFSAGSVSPIGNRPAGVVNGDLLIACVFTNGTVQPGMNSAPAGWTLLNGGYIGPTGTWPGMMFAYWKIAASEPTTWTWSITPSQAWVVQVVAVQNPNDSVNPFDNYYWSSNISNGSSTSIPGFPSISPTTFVNDLLIGFFGTHVSTTIAPDTVIPMTEVQDQATTLTTLETAWALLGAPGPVSTPVATASAAAYGCSVLALVKGTAPSGGAGPRVEPFIWSL